jgi:trehalose 6-phosphate phosphatase
MEPTQQPPLDSDIFLPAFDPAWALFLDVDGTLLDLGQRPADVTVRPGLIRTLEALRRVVPVALVSGRPLADLDRLFAPLVLPAAGQHGAERRSADGRMHRATVSHAALAHAKALLTAWVSAHQGTLLEDKGASLALHFRGAPNFEAEAGRACHDALQRLGDGFLLGTGNMVLEIRPRGWDKGRALAEFMHEKPFAGHVPVFVGDDTTDEDGFRAANRLGGLSIKVGNGPTAARWRLEDVAQVLAWLDRFAQWSARSPSGG